MCKRSEGRCPIGEETRGSGTASHNRTVIGGTSRLRKEFDLSLRGAGLRDLAGAQRVDQSLDFPLAHSMDPVQLTVRPRSSKGTRCESHDGRRAAAQWRPGVDAGRFVVGAFGLPSCARTSRACTTGHPVGAKHFSVPRPLCADGAHRNPPESLTEIRQLNPRPQCRVCARLCRVSSFRQVAAMALVWVSPDGLRASWAN